jgi:hypothetical protein
MPKYRLFSDDALSHFRKFCQAANTPPADSRGAFDVAPDNEPERGIGALIRALQDYAARELTPEQASAIDTLIENSTDQNATAMDAAIRQTDRLERARKSYNEMFPSAARLKTAW